MKRCLLLLLLLFSRVAPAQVDPAPAEQFVRQYAGHYRVSPELVAAAYYAGDHRIAREQLNYHNPDVVAYVLAVRRQFMIRKYAAMRPPRRLMP